MKRKPKPDVAPLLNIQTFQPLELVCLHFPSLEQSKGGQQNILVITDHFIKFAQAYPTKNQIVRTTADILYNQYIPYYGIPKGLHFDQGANFESHLIKDFYAPLEKGGILFCNGRSVGRYVGLSVCRPSLVRSISFDPFTGSIQNLVQGLQSMSRWSLFIFRLHNQRSRSNHSSQPSVLSIQYLLTP